MGKENTSLVQHCWFCRYWRHRHHFGPECGEGTALFRAPSLSLSFPINLRVWGALWRFLGEMFRFDMSKVRRLKCLGRWKRNWSLRC